MKKYASSYAHFKDMQKSSDAASQHMLRGKNTGDKDTQKTREVAPQQMPHVTNAGAKDRLDDTSHVITDGTDSEAAVPVAHKLPVIEAPALNMVAGQPTDTVDLEELRGSDVSILMLTAAALPVLGLSAFVAARRRFGPRDDDMGQPFIALEEP